MSEPTKDRFQLTQNPLTEAHALRKRFGNATKDFALSNAALADLISFVRKKARDDALEGAAKHFLRNGPYVEWFAETIADDLRALKDKPDGEQP